MKNPYANMQLFFVITKLLRKKLHKNIVFSFFRHQNSVFRHFFRLFEALRCPFVTDFGPFVTSWQN